MRNAICLVLPQNIRVVKSKEVIEIKSISDFDQISVKQAQACFYQKDSYEGGKKTFIFLNGDKGKKLQKEGKRSLYEHCQINGYVSHLAS